MVFALALIAIGFFGVACITGFFFLISAIGTVLMAIGTTMRWAYIGYLYLRNFFGGSKSCNSFAK